MTSMPRHRTTVPLALLVLGTAAAGASAAGADEHSFLYTLNSDFLYTQGCFAQPDDWHQCLCPISWAQKFSGTFELTPAHGSNPGFDAYAVSDIHWVVRLGQEIEITGSGTYAIGRDVDCNPVQHMTLELFFDGFGPVTFKSGLVAGGDDGFPPEIEVPVSDGFYCPGCRITVSASAAASRPADVAPLSGDGAVNVLDFLAVVGDWGLPGPRPTDMDGSGAVGLEDVLAVLGAWTG
jgi:hypothetical protein